MMWSMPDCSGGGSVCSRGALPASPVPSVLPQAAVSPAAPALAAMPASSLRRVRSTGFPESLWFKVIPVE